MQNSIYQFPIYINWVKKKKKKKNMLNHDILSQSFNTNTSRWEANGQINGFLLTSL